MSARVRSRRSAADWVMLAVSVFIVGAFVAVALVEESRRKLDDGARITMTFDREGSTLVAGSYYVPYTVTNTGSDAISSADIWIEVLSGGDLVESAEIRVEFLPLQGRQDGIYVSAVDPSIHTLRGRLESLQFP